jgi:DNA-binding HxlR family transcriptional regulator
MRRTRFHRWPCPIARATDVIGDWWTPLVLREAFAGRRRFEEFQRALGTPRAVLARRLERLIEEGMLTKHPYAERPARYEYRLTDKGRAFWNVLAAMWRWGSDWLWDEHGPPVVLVNVESGAEVRPLVVDERTGTPLDLRRLRVKPAPRVIARAAEGAARAAVPAADSTRHRTAPRRRRTDHA